MSNAGIDIVWKHSTRGSWLHPDNLIFRHDKVVVWNFSGITPYHRWASTSISISVISDIDICYSGIGDKYVGLKNVILISKVFQYRHQSSFRYPHWRKKHLSSCRFEPAPLGMLSERYNSKLLWLSVNVGMSDIGYRIKLYSAIRYNIGLHSLSPILEVLISGSVSPISLITDIGLSAHQCAWLRRKSMPHKLSTLLIWWCNSST